MTHSDLISKSMRPFQRRLDFYTALRALLAALTAGGFVCALMTVGYKLTRQQTPMGSGIKWIWLVSGGAAFITLIATFLVFRPNQTEIARQIDALGLKERTACMLALRDSSQEIADLQREDALRHLRVVRGSDLRGRISVLSVVFVLIALLTAAASILLPASWFVREQNEVSSTWDDVFDLLREERDRLAEEGADRFADEFDELIHEMEGMDYVLQAVGKISDVEKNIKDIAYEEETSPAAMKEALDTLKEARQMLLGKEETGADGKKDTEEKEVAGMPAVPDESEQDVEGEVESLAQGSGNKPQNSDRNGKGQSLAEGDIWEQTSSMTEPVYDPISGYVPYGKVFSVYLSDYLRDAENGSIPYEVSDAARSYFEDLDRLQNEG